jgi:type VI secretion system secreted protein Hcp
MSKKTTKSQSMKTLSARSLDAGKASTVRGGSRVVVEYKPQKPDGSLDAGIHFKYDLKAQKEA